MFEKILLFIYIVKVSNAVVIHTSDKYKKDLIKPNSQGWQTVKMYHPPQAFGYKYEPYAYPKYEFEYSVSDKNTGDHKHHSEARDGDRVRGEYSLVQSDGSLRKVQYTADDHNGFNAVVSRIINNHGDHAVSVSGHTQFFYPVGHNVKINHYFPGKDYQYQEIKMSDHKISKPVHEETAVNNKDVKMVMIDSEDKLLAIEPMKEKEEIKDTARKDEKLAMQVDVTETIPIQVLPAVDPVIPDNSNDEKVNAEPLNSVSMDQNSNISPAKELSTENEIQNLNEKENSDSEVASSFYTTKYYYVIQ
ncbi:unnamed protein product [Arctia plantaginis]|uniref:Uncharacterized protein n=1 Tax=Arctia plantaginis TaxID=874455 RepID=A0A8S1ADY8_ARCPL|nr:unnamed protein product [Arctia plantaginis]